MPGATTVDEYVANVPESTRVLFAQLRQAVRGAVPDGTEVVSYRILGMKVNGRLAVWYAAFKDHCSLFPYTERVVQALGDELKPYMAGKGTIRFAAGQPLPVELVDRVVRLLLEERAGARY